MMAISGFDLGDNVLTVRAFTVTKGKWNNCGGIGVSEGAKVDIMLCIFIDNEPLAAGAGAIGVMGQSIVNIYGCTYYGNTAGAQGGADVTKLGGTVTVHETCPSPYTATTPVQGAALQTHGSVQGATHAYSCSTCVATTDESDDGTDGNIYCVNGGIANGFGDGTCECITLHCDEGYGGPNCATCPEGFTGTPPSNCVEEVEDIATDAPTLAPAEPTDAPTLTPAEPTDAPTSTPDEEGVTTYVATIPAAITLENLEVPDVADVETFTNFVDVLQTGILASLDVTGDVDVKIISVGGVPVPETRRNRRLSGLEIEFEIIIKVTEEAGGDTATAARDNLVTAAIGNLVAAVEDGSVTTEIVAAATEKGGDSATVFESVTVDKTAFVAPEVTDVVESGPTSAPTSAPSPDTMIVGDDEDTKEALPLHLLGAAAGGVIVMIIVCYCCFCRKSGGEKEEKVAPG